MSARSRATAWLKEQEKVAMAARRRLYMVATTQSPDPFAVLADISVLTACAEDAGLAIFAATEVLRIRAASV